MCWIHLASTPSLSFFFFLNDPAPTEISPLPLPPPLPISRPPADDHDPTHGTAPSLTCRIIRYVTFVAGSGRHACLVRSEEHTSELQSRQYLVCRLLLEKKKNIHNNNR